MGDFGWDWQGPFRASRERACTHPTGGKPSSRRWKRHRSRWRSQESRLQERCNHPRTNCDRVPPRAHAAIRCKCKSCPCNSRFHGRASSRSSRNHRRKSPPACRSHSTSRHPSASSEGCWGRGRRRKEYCRLCRRRGTRRVRTVVGGGRRWPEAGCRAAMPRREWEQCPDQRQRHSGKRRQHERHH